MTLCLADLEVSKVPKFKTILLDIISAAVKNSILNMHGRSIELNQVPLLFCFVFLFFFFFPLCIHFLSVFLVQLSN